MSVECSRAASASLSSPRRAAQPTLARSALVRSSTSSSISDMLWAPAETGAEVTVGVLSAGWVSVGLGVTSGVALGVNLGLTGLARRGLMTWDVLRSGVAVVLAGAGTEALGFFLVVAVAF